MSPMLDTQRRYSEVFRIRLGEKKISAKGKEYPASLDNQIRVTSPSIDVIDAIVRVYGGTTSDWGDQRQAYLPTDSLRIAILPGDSIAGWWEQWRKKDGGMPVCTMRCDGEHDTLTGEACSCPSITQRLASKDTYCQPTTRLWVMLPDVEVIGTGRLETHGIIAAETLPQSVDVLKHALKRGEMVPAILRIVRVESSGKSFVVPKIEVTGVSLDQVLAGEVAVRSHGDLPSPAGDLAGALQVAPEGVPASLPSLPVGSPSLTAGPLGRGKRTPEEEEAVGLQIDGINTRSATLPGPDGPTHFPATTITTRQLNQLRKNFASIGIMSDLDICARLTAQLGKPVADLRALNGDDVRAVLG